MDIVISFLVVAMVVWLVYVLLLTSTSPRELPYSYQPTAQNKNLPVAVQVDGEPGWGWYIGEILHRNDGPAVILQSGEVRWYSLGELHRTDGPACIDPNGKQRWYYNGQTHRTDGPAIIHPNGDRVWCQHDKRHRVDGPAYEGINGYRAWYFNDERHRLDGPATIKADGTQEWWLNGVAVDELTVMLAKYSSDNQ